MSAAAVLALLAGIFIGLAIGSRFHRDLMREYVKAGAFVQDGVAYCVTKWSE